jgi:hypothetical protein
MTRRRVHEVGVVADTHGLVRPEALAALAGVDAVVHAGDVGSAAVLDALAALAPLTAVRGNNDTGPWARHLPERATVRVGRVGVLVVHDRQILGPLPDGVRVVVSGHAHRPAIEDRDGVLFLNPGSAGPRRFSLPVTVARLTIEGDRVSARLVPLPVAAPGPRRRR